MGMDQTRKFGEQTSRILEFKPEGLDFYVSIFLSSESPNSRGPLKKLLSPYSNDVSAISHYQILISELKTRS